MGRQHSIHADLPWNGEYTRSIDCRILMPQFDDCSQEKFGGEIFHSSQFGSARDYIGKKVVVVGACTSGALLMSPIALLLSDPYYITPGHDICADFYNHGVGEFMCCTSLVEPPPSLYLDTLQM